jgi:hypothetical protein
MPIFSLILLPSEWGQEKEDSTGPSSIEEDSAVVLPSSAPSLYLGVFGRTGKMPVSRPAADFSVQAVHHVYTPPPTHASENCLRRSSLYKRKNMVRAVSYMQKRRATA